MTDSQNSSHMLEDILAYILILYATYVMSNFTYAWCLGHAIFIVRRMTPGLMIYWSLCIEMTVLCDVVTLDIP